MNGHPPSDLHRAFREDITAQAIEVATRLAALQRNATLYGPNNETWIPLILGMNRALAIVHRAERGVLLEVTHGQMSVNGNLIRPTFSQFGAFRALAEGLLRCGIGGVRFDAVPTEDELKGFAYALARVEENAESPFKRASEELRKLGVRSVRALPVGPETRLRGANLRDLRGHALFVFLKGIAAVREVFEGLREGKSVGFKRCRRFVQDAADLLSVDRGLALSLTTIKNYQDYLYNHAVNSCIISLAVGERLGFEKKRLGELGLAALLRNVGEATVPREVLEKQGELSPQEWARFKRFPYAAVTGLLRFRGFTERSLRAILVAFEHQFRSAAERTLTSREFNLHSRIALLADAYDAMTTPRPYRRRPMTPDEALRTLVKERTRSKAGPVLLKSFIHAMGLYPVGTVVLLDTHEVAIVAAPPFDQASLGRPRVRLIAGRDGAEIPGAPLAETTAVDEEGRFLRTIVRTVDPWRYNVNVPSHLLGIEPCLGTK